MPGPVVLVGAGPGDPGLLTLAGRDAIEKAQVLAYDSLVAAAIVDMAPSSAQRIPVTRRADPGAVPHTEIAALMAQKALEGLRVVRLKGGDPFVYGRGYDEIQELRALGIPVRIVPGISAALAAPACCGISVINGNMSGAVHIVSGNPRTGQVLALDYSALVRAGGTLIFLMALDRLQEIGSGLLTAGMPPQTPVAIVENASMPSQRRVDTALEVLCHAARGAGLSEPAVIIIGAVCGV
jgi:uroporphyrinogen III methyltransferase/synthase